MRKISCLLIALFLVSTVLFAVSAEKVAIFPVIQKDRNSQYVVSFLEKRDLVMAFENNSNLILIDRKEVKEALGDNDLNTMEPEERLALGKKLGATIIVWGDVSQEGPEAFTYSTKVMSMRTSEMIPVIVNGMSKNKDQRLNALKKDFVAKINDFASGEIKKIADIAQQNFDTQDYVSAEQNFLKLIEIDPTMVNPYMYLGLIKANNNDYAQAISYYNRGLAVDPNNENILNYISDAYQKSGDLNNAIASLERIAHSKNDENVWLRIALMYKDKQIYDKAETALNEALKINPENLLAHNLYATITYDLKEYEKAIPHLEFVVNANADDDKSTRKLAMCYQKTGQLDKAIEKYRTVITNDPTNIRAYMNLANSFRAFAADNPSLASKYNGEALKTLLDAKKVAPDNAKIYTLLSNLYYELKNYSAAEQFANTAKAKDASQYEPYVILGDITQNRGVGRFNEFVDLKAQTESGKYYGDGLNTLIKKRDAAKIDANNLFRSAENYYSTARAKTENPDVQKDIVAKINANKQYISNTSKGFLN